MGLESRDYYRDGSYSASLAAWGVDFTPVVKYLIIVNVVVFLLQIFFTRPAPLELPGLDAKSRDLPGAARDWLADEDDWDDQANKDAKGDKGVPNREQMEEATRKAREVMERMLTHFPGMRVSVVQEWLELSPEKTILEGQLWRLVTCAFCHMRFGVWHILFNMLMLYWFGPMA